MAQPIPPNKLSQKARGFVGAGIGIIICWFVVNYYPALVGAWALTEWGKVVLLIVQACLFVGSVGSIISVLSIFAQNSKGFKITEIKYKGVEVKFDVKDEDDSEPV